MQHRIKPIYKVSERKGRSRDMMRDNLMYKTDQELSNLKYFLRADKRNFLPVEEKICAAKLLSDFAVKSYGKKYSDENRRRSSDRIDDNLRKYCKLKPGHIMKFKQYIFEKWEKGKYFDRYRRY